MAKRLDDFSKRLGNIEAEIRELRGRFWWIIGILFSMWVTIIFAILRTRP